MKESRFKKIGKRIQPYLMRVIFIVLAAFMQPAAIAAIIVDDSTSASSKNVPDYKATVTAQSGLNVRSGPGANYPKISKLRYGSTVTVTHHYGGWSKIKLGPTKGAYVSNRYLRRSNSTSSAPGNSQTTNSGSATTSRPNSNERNVPDYRAIVTASALNVRSGPGTNHGIIGKRYRNSSVVVTHRNGHWRKIAWSQGSSAYVHGDFLRKRDTPSRLRDLNARLDGEEKVSPVAFGSSAWASTLSDSELQQRIDNWQGTDNDPILDRLVSERNRRLHKPEAKVENPELTTTSSPSTNDSLLNESQEVRPPLPMIAVVEETGVQYATSGSKGDNPSLVMWPPEGGYVRFNYDWDADSQSWVETSSEIGTAGGSTIFNDYVDPDNSYSNRPERPDNRTAYERMQEHYDPNGDKYSGYPMHITPGMFPDGPISPDFNNYPVGPDPLISSITEFCGIPFTSTSLESAIGTASSSIDVVVNGVGANTFLIPFACSALGWGNQYQGSPTIYGPNRQNMPYGNGLPRDR